MKVLVDGNHITEDKWPRREQGLDLRLHDALEHLFTAEGRVLTRVEIKCEHLHRCSVELHVIESDNAGDPTPEVVQLSHDELVERLSNFLSSNGQPCVIEVFYHASMYFVLTHESAPAPTSTIAIE